MPVSHRQRSTSPLLHMLLVNALIGGALGVIFVGGVLWLDLGHVRSLAFAAPDGWIAVALLSVGSVVTFASVVMGGAIMLMPKSDDAPPRAHKKRTSLALGALAPAKAGARSRPFSPKA